MKPTENTKTPYFNDCEFDTYSIELNDCLQTTECECPDNININPTDTITATDSDIINIFDEFKDIASKFKNIKFSYEYPTICSTIYSNSKENKHKILILHEYYKTNEDKLALDYDITDYDINKEIKIDNNFKKLVFIDRIRPYLYHEKQNEIKTSSRDKIDSCSANITAVQMYYYTLYRNNKLDVSDDVYEKMLKYDEWIGEKNSWTCVVNDLYSPILNNFKYLIDYKNKDSENIIYIYGNMMTKINEYLSDSNKSLWSKALLKALYHRFFGLLTYSKIYISAAAVLYHDEYENVTGFYTPNIHKKYFKDVGIVDRTYNTCLSHRISLKTFELLINDRPLWIHTEKDNNIYSYLYSESSYEFKNYNGIIDMPSGGGYSDNLSFYHTTRIEIIKSFLQCITSWYNKNDIDCTNYRLAYRIDINKSSITDTSEFNRDDIYVVRHYNIIPVLRKPYDNVADIYDEATKQDGFEKYDFRMKEKLLFHFVGVDVHYRSEANLLEQSLTGYEDVSVITLPLHVKDIDDINDAEISLKEPLDEYFKNIDTDIRSRGFYNKFLLYYTTIYEPIDNTLELSYTNYEDNDDFAVYYDDDENENENEDVNENEDEDKHEDNDVNKEYKEYKEYKEDNDVNNTDYYQLDGGHPFNLEFKNKMNQFWFIKYILILFILLIIIIIIIIIVKFYKKYNNKNEIK